MGCLNCLALATGRSMAGPWVTMCLKMLTGAPAMCLRPGRLWLLRTCFERISHLPEG